LYSDLSRTPAWLDLTSRLQNMRDEIVRELLLGTLDTYGHDHSDAKRAVLVYIDRTLAFVPTLLDTYTVWTKKRDIAEAKSRQRNDLHPDLNLPPGVSF